MFQAQLHCNFRESHVWAEPQVLMCIAELLKCSNVQYTEVCSEVMPIT